MLSFEYCEIFNNTYFEEHMQMTAYVSIYSVQTVKCTFLLVITEILTEFLYIVENNLFKRNFD